MLLSIKILPLESLIMAVLRALKDMTRQQKGKEVCLSYLFVVVLQMLLLYRQQHHKFHLIHNYWKSYIRVYVVHHRQCNVHVLLLLIN
jgi:hypothetical protein